MRPFDPESADAADGGAPSTGDAAATVEGTVVEALPSGLYRVEAGGRAMTVHAGRGEARNFVRVLIGDRVVVEAARRDPTRGRILRKA